jgi:hypothetical protein
MEEEPPRAERRESAQSRNRRLLFIIGGVVLALVAVALIVVLVSGGGGGGGGKTATKPTASQPAPGTKVTLQLGDVSADSAGPPAQLTPDQAQAVLTVMRNYLTIATVQPLRSGKPAGDLAGVFDPGAIATVNGTDRGVMIDEGLPKVTGELDVAAQPVTVVALADQTGAILLATAKLDVDITGGTKVKGAPLHILRQGDFVLTPDASGAWKVTQYNVTVARSGAGLDPTTTTAATPTTTKKKGSK